MKNSDRFITAMTQQIFHRKKGIVPLTFRITTLYLARAALAPACHFCVHYKMSAVIGLYFYFICQHPTPLNLPQGATAPLAPHLADISNLTTVL